MDLQIAAHTEETVATLVRTLRSLLVGFPKKASEDLEQLTKAGKASGEFVVQCKEVIEQSEQILALYKEEEPEEEGEAKGETEEDNEEEGEEVDEMEDEEGGEEEMEEDMKNILEYRLGQMLILMWSIKYAHATLLLEEKKRKHFEI